MLDAGEEWPATVNNAVLRSTDLFRRHPSGRAREYAIRFEFERRVHQKGIRKSSRVLRLTVVFTVCTTEN